MSEDLVQWLRAQLDVDAEHAVQWHDLECEIHAHQDGGLLAAIAAMEMLDQVSGAVCDCGGPARVLREIDAKRQALAHYAKIREYAENGAEAYVLAEGAVSKQIQIMATAYADRPGYQEEKWRP